MTRILKLNEIKKILEGIDPIKIIEEGFIAYSQGKVVVPPIGEMIFDDPKHPGDCHIKYGFIKNDEYYVVKIAQGFYNNPKVGLPSTNGLNILFNQKNGAIECILLDEGYLTDVRTASAGAIAAKYMAPKNVNRIGIFGTGLQGKMQLQFLKSVVDCRKASIWGRGKEQLKKYQDDMASSEFEIETTMNSNDITNSCNLIVTCTPSKLPLINADQVLKGMHITAMGSDTSEKQELESKILQKSDRVVVDSLSQAGTRGECFHAIRNGDIKKDRIIELGNMITDKNFQRANDDEITIVDLTGVAVQDIQISKAVYEGYLSLNK
ncbi:ornithine cyclodeaminase family protein [Candidatus Heimdallarchaeota archaeon B3_Heim]|nr:MAG: ornithine cyclodeaminase family protein [Candidatus Heimdallarchaeota archaeon B3_Heim]